MSARLIIFAQELRSNSSYLSYVLRAFKARGVSFSRIIFADKSSIDLPLLLEDAVAECKQVALLCDERGQALATRVLSTISGSSLQGEGEQLGWQNALAQEPNSVLLSAGEALVNLLCVSSSKALPAMLLEGDAEQGFLLLDVDLESALILLEAIAQGFGLSIYGTSLLENLVQINIKTGPNSDVAGFYSAAATLFSGKLLQGTDLIAHNLHRLRRAGLCVSFAESCSGGMLAAALTANDGASMVFEQGFISYSAAAKECMLGVKSTQGAMIYSPFCAHEMARGALQLSGADFALAATGVLGALPSFGVEGGTVQLCAMRANGAFLDERVVLYGDRLFRQQSLALAANLLLARLAPGLFLE